MTDLKRSYLVQRLTAPPERDHPIFGKGNPFSFGGGLTRGGLSEEAMEAVHQAFDFDYMGAAEYEFGAVPQALNVISEGRKTLKSTVINVDLTTVRLPPFGKPKRGQGSAPIFIIADRSWLVDVSGRVIRWACDNEKELRDPTHINRTLVPQDKWDGQTLGWLELTNGFMFFADETMFNNTCDLFGVKRAVSA